MYVSHSLNTFLSGFSAFFGFLDIIILHFLHKYFKYYCNLSIQTLWVYTDLPGTPHHIFFYSSSFFSSSLLSLAARFRLKNPHCQENKEIKRQEHKPIIHLDYQMHPKSRLD